MPQFLRTDIDFGIPGIVFEIDARTMHGIKLRHDLQDEIGFIAQSSQILTDDVKLDRLRKVLEQTVVRFRPELAGLVVVWVEVKLHPPTWEVGVIHPSLPRCLDYGTQYPKERLETCYVCGKGISNDFGTQLWMKKVDNPNDSRQCALVCSEECLNA